MPERREGSGHGYWKSIAIIGVFAAIIVAVIFAAEYAVLNAPLSPLTGAFVQPVLCADANGDGIPESYKLDADKKKYCLEMLVSGGTTDADTILTLHGYHEDGIYNLQFGGDAYNMDVVRSKLCALATQCSLELTIPAAGYTDKYLFDGWLSPRSRKAVKVTTVVEIKCGSEYCPPSPKFLDFFEWMRSRGYKECIAGYYIDRTNNINASSIMKRFLSLRPSNITQPYQLDFYDIIPTDENSTYKSLAEGEGGDCQPSPAKPDFCPSPVPADYKFVERHFEKTFGIDFDFVYHRRETNYVQEIGQPKLVVVNSTYSYYQFPSAYTFQQKLGAPRHSIVHYAIKYLNGKIVRGMTTGALVTQVSLEPYTALGQVTYSHEFGHTWSLPHPFYGSPVRTFMQLDGIMGNTYGGSQTYSSNLFDPTDPLERYAMEPLDSFADESTFAARYSDANFTGFSCGVADPGIAGAAIIKQDDSAITFELTLNNSGNAIAGYFSLAAYDGSPQGNLVEERIIEQIKPKAQLKHAFTVSKAGIPSGNAVFVIDRKGTILGENEDDNMLPTQVCEPAPAQPVCEGALSPVYNQSGCIVGYY